MAMSGCGWLTPFYFGVIDTMRQRKLLTEKSYFGGTSGGSLGALIACTDVSTKLALDTVIELSKNNNFKRDIDAGLKDALRSLLPDNILELCNGRLHVAVTKVWPELPFGPTIISNFTSTENLLNVIAASCFIPYYSAPRLATLIDSKPGELFTDGGVFAFMPPMGRITVSPLSAEFFPITPPGWTYNPHICIPNGVYSKVQLLTWTLKPAPVNVLRDLYKHGQIAAAAYIDATDRPPV